MDKLQAGENFVAWGSRIVTNTALDLMRKNGPVLLDEDKDIDELDYQPVHINPSAGDSPEKLMDQKETSRLISEMISTLSGEQRICIYLFYMQEMSVKEIAASVGVSENTVKSRLKYGRDNIEKKVLLMEKQGTKLYGLAPLPFFVWIFRSTTGSAEAAEIVASSIKVNLIGQLAAGGSKKAAKQVGFKIGSKVIRGAGKAASAGTVAETSAGSAGAIGGFVSTSVKAVAVKTVIGITAVGVAAGGVSAVVRESRKNDVDEKRRTAVLEKYRKQLEDWEENDELEVGEGVFGLGYIDRDKGEKEVFGLGYIDGDNLPELVTAIDTGYYYDDVEYPDTLKTAILVETYADDLKASLYITAYQVTLCYYEGTSILSYDFFVDGGPLEENGYQKCNKNALATDLTKDELDQLTTDLSLKQIEFHENTEENREKYLQIKEIGENSNVKQEGTENIMSFSTYLGDNLKIPYAEGTYSNMDDGEYGDILWIRKDGDRYNVDFLVNGGSTFLSYGYPRDGKLMLRSIQQTGEIDCAQIVWDEEGNCTYEFLKDRGGIFPAGTTYRLTREDDDTNRDWWLFELEEEWLLNY